MIRINIVTEPEPGWVLRRIAKSFAKFVPNSTVKTQADEAADINFYVNYALYKKKTSIDVALFTHREFNHHFTGVFDDVAKEVDWCVAMCDKTASFLPKNKTSVIHVAPDPQFQKGKIVFGLVGKEKKNGRKRMLWVDELRKIEGIEIRATNGEIAWEKLPDFYKSIDYLLILADNEGGPVPLLEALAMGVPVISSDVGFVSDYTTIRFNTLEELKDVINRLIIPHNAEEISANKLKNVFEHIWKMKNNN